MDLQRLRYFLEVARQKHFSRAAEVCCVSQPSLSQQIKKLEEEVGGMLFRRTRGKVILTPLGDEFLKHAQAILAEVQSAEEFVNRSQNNLQRTLRFGAIPTIAPYLIPDLFLTIQKHEPQARFELIENFTDPLIESLLTGSIDFVLFSPPTRIDQECDYLTLARDELLLTLPLGHALCKESRITSDQLANENIILLENSHCLAEQTSAYCNEIGLNQNIHIRSSQIDTLLSLVEKGFGLTFTPAIATKAHQHREVVFRPIASNPCYREVRLAWLKRQFLPRSQRVVLESLRDYPSVVASNVSFAAKNKGKVTL